MRFRRRAARRQLLYQRRVRRSRRDKFASFHLPLAIYKWQIANDKWQILLLRLQLPELLHPHISKNSDADFVEGAAEDISAVILRLHPVIHHLRRGELSFRDIFPQRESRLAFALVAGLHQDVITADLTTVLEQVHGIERWCAWAGFGAAVDVAGSTDAVYVGKPFRTEVAEESPLGHVFGIVLGGGGEKRIVPEDMDARRAALLVHALEDQKTNVIQGITFVAELTEDRFLHHQRTDGVRRGLHIHGRYRLRPVRSRKRLAQLVAGMDLHLLGTLKHFTDGGHGLLLCNPGFRMQ